MPQARFMSQRVDELELSPLTAIGSVDGRYARLCKDLRAHFSEYALIKQRVEVELTWLQYLSQDSLIKEVPTLSAEGAASLQAIAADFDLSSAQRVKEIERTTNHDMKAVEYFIKEKMAAGPAELADLKEFVHFGCTSEDINNLAYARCVAAAMEEVMLPTMHEVRAGIHAMAQANAAVPMLARTHGQPASPTTVGKEMAVFANRLSKHYNAAVAARPSGKFSGATGTYAALTVAYPDKDWAAAERDLVVDGLGLEHTLLSTQIEPHDWLAELFHAMSRFNSVLLDFNRDMWAYVSLGYFKQKAVEGEIGSSTMPHKVNPIAFENSEGNIGLANATMTHMAEKLLVSRFQRDLSDSTVLRAIGVGFAHSLIAYKQAQVGMSRVAVNEAKMDDDLEANWEVLAEPIQTVMRRYGVDNPYEKLKELTRGKRVTKEGMQAFVRSLEAEGVPASAIAELEKLTPQTYVGIAERIAKYDLR